MLTAIVGINWGDEGKGRMVDLLGAQYDIIVRYQGGNNAGHTVVNEKGKFILNLLPSGILRDNTVNVMGPGMVIDIEHLCKEITGLVKKGIRITPDNLKISHGAAICFPYHVRQDILEEERLGDRKYGSTRRGIAPVYADKYIKKGIRMGDLLFPDTLREKLEGIIEWKNLLIHGGNHDFMIDTDKMLKWLQVYGEPLMPFVCDVSDYLDDAAGKNKNILFEAQLGALRDIDYGIYPYTTSSSTLASYATTGAGIPGAKLDKVIGIMKAYSSCVGEGLFVAEFFGEEGSRLREAGSEYGAATGRPRRVGAFDIPASRYGIKVQGADEIALTKLDVLSYMEKIPVCVAYEIEEKRTDRFPIGESLLKAKPIIELMDGWKCDISSCRKKEDLPEAASAYIRFIEEMSRCRIRYVSVGAERDAYIDMDAV
ncbi:MAG: adenylosuccinate synthase [Clostridiales bacterium]|nr:adenylosuccinate synthase [Clostridiales bacterium]